MRLAGARYGFSVGHIYVMRDLTVIGRVHCSFGALVGSLLLLLTAFPYVQLIPSENYTQPYALLLGVMIFSQGWPQFFRLACSDKIALLGLAVVGFGIFLATCFPYANSQEYKYLLSYLSPLLLTIPILNYFKNYPARAIGILKFAIFFWIATATIQKFLDPKFLGFLIGQWGESAQDIIDSGRGVLSLAPEPNHHAFHILLLAACLSLVDCSNRSRRVVIFCIVDAVLLAASASAILVLGVSGLAWALFYRQRWFIMAVALVIFSSLGGAFGEILMSSDLRMGRLIGAFFADPSSILSADQSINTRIGGIFSVFLASFNNSLIPHGLSMQSWDAARNSMITDLPWLLDLSSVGPPSGIGLLIFQAGLFGLLFIGIIFRRILSLNVGVLGHILLISSLMIFLGQFYISAPTFSLLYACSLYRFDMENEFHKINGN